MKQFPLLGQTVLSPLQSPELRELHHPQLSLPRKENGPDRTGTAGLEKGPGLPGYPRQRLEEGRGGEGRGAGPVSPSHGTGATGRAGGGPAWGRRELDS